jgi:riboflavin biosynthesis pyrimidine reductase
MALSWRPHIHLNVATDDEGAVADADRKPKLLSCDADWRRVHELRERYDAVAVGGRTWIEDRPRLTARADRLGRPPRRQPAVVVFAGGQAARAARLENRTLYWIGMHDPKCEGVIFVPWKTGELGEPLAALRRAGVSSMLVEGGPTLLRSFVSEGFVDRITVFVRTRRVGGEGRALRRLFPGVRFDVRTIRFGEGVLSTCALRPEDEEVASGWGRAAAVRQAAR